MNAMIQCLILWLIPGKTPTAAAELLIHRVAEVAEHLEELSMRIQQGAYMLLDLERRRLETLQTRIPNLVHRKLADARFLFAGSKEGFVTSGESIVGPSVSPVGTFTTANSRRLSG